MRSIIVLPGLVLAGLVAGLGLGGCAPTTGVAYSGAYYSDPYGPDLVAIDAGVSVIPDYDIPIFYVDGYYWRSYNNYWYRSPYHTRGWSYVARPPRAIARIDRPYRYSRYRPQGYVPRQRVYRGSPQPSRGATRPEYRGDARPEYRGSPRPEYRGDARPEYRGDARPEYRGAPQPSSSAPRPEYRGSPQPVQRGSAQPVYRGSPQPVHRGSPPPTSRPPRE